jgi:hypothetical protein
MSRLVGSRGVAAMSGAGIATLLLSTPAAAHGVAAGPPDAGMLLTSWSFDIEVWLPVILAAWGYLVLVRSVDRAHPASSCRSSTHGSCASCRTPSWRGPSSRP